MVIRHIREHVATHNWFAVGVDFLIVVAGIVIGLQVSNWNQARIERNQGGEYRERLIEDMRSNEADMRQRRVYYLTVRDHAVGALEALENPSTPTDERLLIDAYQATQIMPRTIKRFTYDELISAGGLERLGDAKLREHVVNYYNGLQTSEAILGLIPPYREHLRRVMPYAVQQRVRLRCAEIVRTDSSGAQIGALPQSCSLDLNQGTVANATAQIRRSPGIIGDLTRYLNDLDVKLDRFSLVESRARNLRQQLESESG